MCNHLEIELTPNFVAVRHHLSWHQSLVYGKRVVLEILLLFGAIDEWVYGKPRGGSLPGGFNPLSPVSTRSYQHERKRKALARGFLTMALSNATATTPDSSDKSWQMALDRLDPDLKTALIAVGTRKVDIVSAVLRAAEARRQLCIRKQWRFTAPNGKIIVVRDVIERVVGWIDRYKSVGDVASQYDQVHAALPWAAFRFLLRVATGDVQAFGLTVAVLERVARIMARSKLIDEVYIRGPTYQQLPQPLVLGRCIGSVILRRFSVASQVCQILWTFYHR